MMIALLGASFTTIQTGLLLILALIAVGVNFFAAFKGPKHTFALNFARGFLAFIYFCGYVWLLVGQPDRANWSEIMSGVALATWPVVWILPPLFTYWQRNRVQDSESATLVPKKRTDDA